MNRLRSAIIILWTSALTACAGEVSTAADSGPLDGAVIDGAAGIAAQIPRTAPLTPATAAMTAAARAPSPSWQPIDGQAAAGEFLIASPRAATAASPAQVEQLEDELDGGELAPYPGVALASSIAGIRALVGDLHGEPVEHARVRVLENDDNVLALANAPDTALDASTRAWRRRAVRVLTSAQQSCTGRVASLELATPWIWKEEAFDAQARPSDGEMRAALRGWLGSVVAHVVLDDPGSCRGRPLLVQEAALPSPRVARALPRVPHSAKLLAAFHGLAEYRALQTECVRQGECSKDPATGLPVDRPVELAAFRFVNDSAVYVTASIAEEGCAAWGPPLSAIFVLEPARGAKPALRRVNARAELGSPLLLLDLGGDGRFELVTHRFAGDLELIDEDGSSRQSWSTHFVGCHC